jgi:hypothetical protein
MNASNICYLLMGSTWKLGRAKKLVERLHYENLVVLMRDCIFKKQSVHTWQNFDNHSLSNDKQLGVFRQRECLKSLFIVEADAHYESKEKRKLSKVLPFCLLVVALSVLSEIGRTSAPSSPAVASQFVLSKSYGIDGASQDMLASVYSTGEGPRRKEVLSIWSRESYGYELQYIKTASVGENFLQPSVLEIQGMQFINVSISHKSTQHPATVATLWIAPDASLHEVNLHHAKTLQRIAER